MYVVGGLLGKKIQLVYIHIYPLPPPSMFIRVSEENHSSRDFLYLIVKSVHKNVNSNPFSSKWFITF